MVTAVREVLAGIKTPVLAVVRQSAQVDEDTAAGDASARVVTDVSEREARRVLRENADMAAHLMSSQLSGRVPISRRASTTSYHPR